MLEHGVGLAQNDWCRKSAVRVYYRTYFDGGKISSEFGGLFVFRNRIYGVITTVSTWRFLVLESTTVLVDDYDRPVHHTNELLGLLVYILQKG